MDDIDIFRVAKAIVDEHGADASTHAAERRDAMKERGDLPGMQIWIRVGRAIDKLQSTEGGPMH